MFGLHGLHNSGLITLKQALVIPSTSEHTAERDRMGNWTRNSQERVKQALAEAQQLIKRFENTDPNVKNVFVNIEIFMNIELV